MQNFDQSFGIGFQQRKSPFCGLNVSVPDTANVGVPLFYRPEQTYGAATILTPASVLERVGPQSSLTPPREADHRKKPVLPTEEATRYWQISHCIRWNEIARDLGCDHRLQAPSMSRVCALISVAQYDAAVLARVNSETGGGSPSWSPGPANSTLTFERASIAAASAKVLQFLFPQNSGQIASWLAQSQHFLSTQDSKLQTVVNIGESLGRIVAEHVIAHARADASDAIWKGSVPHGNGLWSGKRPVLPLWGTIHTWMVADRACVCPPPPPDIRSERFREAVDEVVHITQERTPDQFRIAHRWGDGVGTYTPPGRWNAIACDALTKGETVRSVSELETATVLALLNMALMDSGICCWETKYKYWLLRPSQADTRVRPAMTVPSFPSYVSGHASFSSTGAEILSHIWPEQSVRFHQLAEEASISRLFAGIHYRFDCDNGMSMGKKIAHVALEKARSFGISV